MILFQLCYVLGKLLGFSSKVTYNQSNQPMESQQNTFHPAGPCNYLNGQHQGHAGRHDKARIVADGVQNGHNHHTAVEIASENRGAAANSNETRVLVALVSDGNSLAPDEVSEPSESDNVSQTSSSGGRLPNYDGTFISVRQQWKDIGDILDRFMAIFFLLANLLALAILFPRLNGTL